MNNFFKQAFTLIELLVVIAIIGILSGLIVVSMGGMTDKASVAKLKVFSNSVRNSLMANIVGEWKIDEGSGASTSDTWGGVNNGTLAAAFTDTTAGYGDTHAFGWMSSANCVSGTCLKFNGTSTYVGCGTGSSLNLGTKSFTIGSWMKTTSLNVLTIVAKGSTNAAYNQGRYIFRTASGYLEFLVGNNTTGSPTVSALDNTVLLKDDKWHYVVGTRDANIIKIYVDGVYKTQADTTTTYDVNNDVVAVIGAQYSTQFSNYANFFNGSIDEVRIFNAAMSISQVKGEYYAGLNELLASGGIAKEDYQNRIEELAIIEK